MAANDSAEFDEDIILPNSPLAEYVKGLTADESGLLFSGSSTNRTTGTENSKNCVVKPESKSFSLKTLYLREKCFWKNLVTVCFLQRNLEKGNEHLNDFMNSTIKNGLLTHEDKSFLSHLLPDTDVLDPRKPLLSAKPVLYSFLSFALYCISAFIGAALNNFLLILFPTILFGLFFTYIFSYFLYCKNIGRKYENACFSLINFPSSTKTALSMIKDSGIRLIQEAELIARGFTSASVLGVAEHIELSFTLPITSPSRQYSELRKCIFNWLRIAFIDYKTLTLDMMQNIPVEKTFNATNCLATLNIDEFGGFLNHDLESPEILEITDNFSIQSLKTMHYLAQMQISEFFKQLSVRLYCLNKKEAINAFKLIEDIKWLASQTETVDDKMKKMVDDIHDTCKYYKSIEASYVSEEAKNGFKVKSPKSDLKVILHNMSLHLKAALLRLIEIENQVGNENTNHAGSDPKLDTETELEEFKKLVLILLPQLHVAKSEVTAFEEYYNKFTRDFDTLLHPEKQTPTKSMLQNEPEPDSADNGPTVLERCDIDREIQDEVFEAVVSHSCHGNQQEGAAFIGEEARKNSELASFMMKELKNVLVNKADEHKAREEVALAKKTAGVKTEIGDNKTEIVTLEMEHKACEEVALAKKMAGVVDVKTETGEKKTEIVALEMNEDVEKIEDADNVEENVEIPESDGLDFSNLVGEKTDSFAASIAMLAAQRQKMMGLSNEEFIDGSDSDDLTD